MEREGVLDVRSARLMVLEPAAPPADLRSPGSGAVFRLAVVVAPCALGLLLLAAAARTALQQTEIMIGPVSDVYLASVAGALLVMLSLLLRVHHREHPADSPDEHTDLEVTVAHPLPSSRDDAAPASEGPAPASLGGTSARRAGAADSAQEMVAAYKRAAESHAEEARQQQLRAEAAEARTRELEAELAGYEDGSTDAARVLHARIAAAADLASYERFAAFSDACDGVIRQLREERTTLEEDRAAARDVAERLERNQPRLLALAASYERQRIQRLARELVTRYGAALPPDRAQLAREQADHLLAAIEEMPIAESVRRVEEHAGLLTSGAAGRSAD